MAERNDRDLANKSGIPLQRHIAELVRQSRSQGRHQWNVEEEEVPTGAGFLDMVLSNRMEMFRGDPITVKMAIEVKCLIDSTGDRPMRLLFLRAANCRESASKAVILPYQVRDWPRQGINVEHRLWAGTFVLTQDAPTAQHCIFEERKGTASMDSIARELLQHVESLSLARLEEQERHIIALVVVTNAELRLLELTETDLELGVMTSGSDHGDAVPWLRYEKTLSATGLVPSPGRRASTLMEWAAERKRTVFVVRALHLVEFLAGFYLEGRPWDSLGTLERLL